MARRGALSTTAALIFLAPVAAVADLVYRGKGLPSFSTEEGSAGGLRINDPDDVDQDLVHGAGAGPSHQHRLRGVGRRGVGLGAGPAHGKHARQLAVGARPGPLQRAQDNDACNEACNEQHWCIAVTTDPGSCYLFSASFSCRVWKTTRGNKLLCNGRARNV